MKSSLRQNALLKFLISSGLTYLLLFLIYQFIVKRNTFYDQKFIGSIISGANYLLTSLNFKTFMVLQDRDFQVIGIHGSTGVWVGSNCNAISLFILFSIFIICYPGHQKAKLWFVPFGIITIHLLNIIRVVCLVILARFYPKYLDFNHTYTFTFLVYAYIFCLWVWWVNKFSHFKSESK